jgi:hypothetical protein
MVVEALVISTAVILYIAFEVGMFRLVFRELGRNKEKTGRYSIPWENLSPIRKGLLITLSFVLIGFFIWLYSYSIFAPESGEYYNLEIALIGLIFALGIIGNLWMIRN